MKGPAARESCAACFEPLSDASVAFPAGVNRGTGCCEACQRQRTARGLPRHRDRPLRHRSLLRAVAGRPRGRSHQDRGPRGRRSFSRLEPQPGKGGLRRAVPRPAAARSHGRPVQVQDDGAGIPPDVLPNLFEPFFTTRERGHGLGLGLAISRSIIERHRGRIDVQSQPGSGTVFTILLPVGARSHKSTGEGMDALPVAKEGDPS